MSLEDVDVSPEALGTIRLGSAGLIAEVHDAGHAVSVAPYVLFRLARERGMMIEAAPSLFA